MNKITKIIIYIYNSIYLLKKLGGGQLPPKSPKIPPPMPESKENFNIPKAITPSKTPSQIFTNKRIGCFKRLRELKV